MNQILNLQMSIFGAFSGIKADAALASELISLYRSELIPSVSPLAVLNPLDGSMSLENRQSMLSSDGELSIVFLPERIDCNYSFKSNVYPVCDIEEKIGKLCNLLTTAICHFSLVSNRIAINGQFINSDASSTQNDYIVLNEFYSDKSLTEWSVSTNAVTEATIDGKCETVNNILSLSLAHNVAGEKALMVRFDINTVPLNTAMRFSERAVSDFYEFATVNLKLLLSKYR